MSSCAICGTPSQPNMLNRISSLDVCDDCTHGDLAARTAPRGWISASREWTTESENATYFNVEAYVETPAQLPIQGTFSRKGILEKGFALFGGGLKIGDETFDSFIAVTTPTKDIMKQFLQGEGPQNAIMELVGEGGKVILSGGQLRCKARSTETITAQPFHLQCCALMHHLLVFATQ